MENIINKLKILMKEIYNFEVKFAEKYNITELRFVKSGLEKMRRDVEDVCNNGK